MNKVIDTIIKRRTIRNYKPQQIDPEVLKEILDAGLYAPSGGGRQSPVMLVCQDAEVNEQLGRLNRRLFGKANSDGIRFVSRVQRSIADDDNIASGFYGAPTVVTLFSPRKWAYGVHDCTAAAVTMSLAAWSLGIGCCYVSRAEETFETELGKEVMARAGIGVEYVARVCLCLGYPEGETGDAKARREGRVVYY